MEEGTSAFTDSPSGGDFTSSLNARRRLRHSMQNSTMAWALRTKRRSSTRKHLEVACLRELVCLMRSTLSQNSGMSMPSMISSSFRVASSVFWNRPYMLFMMTWAGLILVSGRERRERRDTGGEVGTERGGK